MRVATLAFVLAASVTLTGALDETAYRSAVELYTHGKPLEAQKAFEVLAATNRDNGQIQFYLGRLALQRDAYAQAVEYLERAATLLPGDSRIQHRLGDAYGRSAQKAGLFAQLGWAKKCRAAYERAVHLDPTNLDARWSLMEYFRQAPGIAGGGVDKALAQAQEIQKLDPRRGRQARISVYVAEKKYGDAFALCEETLRINPADGDTLYTVGRLAALSGERLDRGLAALRDYLVLEPETNHARTHTRIGDILLKQDDKPGARTAYEAALTADPRYKQAADALHQLRAD